MVVTRHHKPTLVSGRGRRGSEETHPPSVPPPLVLETPTCPPVLRRKRRVESDPEELGHHLVFYIYTGHRDGVKVVVPETGVAPDSSSTPRTHREGPR